MNQKHIQIVLSVAKNLSFSEAAYETSYAASVVSKSVIALENELGVRLFERKARSKVALTEMGRQIIVHLARMQSEYAQIQGLVGSLSTRKTIRFVCPRGFSGLGEDELISIFCTQNPDIEVRQLEGVAWDWQNPLVNGEVDIAIWMFTDEQFEFEAKHLRRKNLVFTKLSENGLGIVLKRNHPAIREGRVDLARLRDERFIFRAFRETADDDPKLRFFQDACRAEGFEPKIQLYRDMRAWAAYALAAKGNCVIPLMHAPAVLHPETCYLPFTKVYYSFTVSLIYRKDDPSQAVKKFVKCARENAHVFSAFTPLPGK